MLDEGMLPRRNTFTGRAGDPVASGVGDGPARPDPPDPVRGPAPVLLLGHHVVGVVLQEQLHRTSGAWPGLARERPRPVSTPRSRRVAAYWRRCGTGSTGAHGSAEVAIRAVAADRGRNHFLDHDDPF